MHIDRVRLDILEVPFRTPLTTAAGTWSRRRIGLLRVTSDGLEGIGEVTDDQPGGIDRIELGPLPAALGGLDIAAVSALDEALDALEAGAGIGRPLRSAAESAVVDLVARDARRSVAGWLAERSRPSVRVNGFIGIDTPARVAEEARRQAAAGMTCLKLKAGHEPFETIAARLAAIRAVVGPALGLRLDFNGTLPLESARRMLDALGGFDLEYVEQPIAVSAGAEALARLRHDVAVPIAADESVQDAASVNRLLDSGACDVLVLKPARVGGLLSASRLARLAADASVACVISTMFETGIGLAGALQLAATLSGDWAHGLATLDRLTEHLLVEPLDIEDGRMGLPDGPGLGVELDAAALERRQLR